MTESEEEKAQSEKNQQIIETLRESFRSAERRLTHEIEPALVFSPAMVPESAE